MTHLKRNALSLRDTVVLAIAGTAPSYTLNATTATLVAAVGLGGPAAILYGAIPMFGIAIAFMFLNQWRNDAGAVYGWVGRSISPSLGFGAAWTFLVLSTVFMVTAAVPAGVVTLELVAPQLKENVVVATSVAGLWLVGISTVTILGVSLAARFQTLMTAIEVLSLLVLAVAAVVKVAVAPVHAFSWQWFSPTVFESPQVFASGIVLSAFYFFGWDVSSNVGEETQGGQRTPGLSGLLGMVAVFSAFEIMQVLMQMGLPGEVIEKNSASLLPALGNYLLPGPWGNIAILAVLVSTIGTLETQLTQCARVMFSMSRDRVLSPHFEQLHPRFATPWVASLLIMVLATFLMVLSSASSSIGDLMTNLVSAIGVMVSIYYGLSGLACVWYYRKALGVSAQALWLKGIWPGASAVVLLGIGVSQFPALGWTVSLSCLAALGVGVVPMLFYRWKYKSDFYEGEMDYAGNRRSVGRLNHVPR
jgi:amino acid transporter